MEAKISYGQFCPLAMAAEFLCKRWMMLVLRELLLGSVSFNDIARGVPRMSRTLLSQRLRELEERGLVTKRTKSNNRETKYTLTPAGESLGKVVFGMAEWSQEWFHIEPSLDNIDPDHLLWSIRRGAQPHPDLPDPFIVHIILSDQPESHQNAWLIYEEGEVELCIIDNDFKVDVQIEASARTLTKIWMGWSTLSEATRSGEITLRGSDKYIRITEKWFGQSRLANIEKQELSLRVS